MRALAGLGVAVVAAGIVSGAILGFRFLHGSADTMVTLAPSDSIAYVNINLDPPGDQKLAVAGVLAKFPGLSDSSRDASVNSWLDGAFSGSGITHGDLRSWLGSEISFAVLPNDASGNGSTPAYVVLAASSNDSAARAMFDKLRMGPLDQRGQWTASTYDGVSVNWNASLNTAYAVDGGTAMVGNTPGAVDEVLDTARGKRANLQSTSDYSTVQSQLPSDRLACVFVDMPALAGSLAPSLNHLGGNAAQTLSTLKAYRGIGAAVVAESNGLTIEATQDYDTSQLSAAQRAGLAAQSRVNGALAFVPQSAFGFFSLSGLSDDLNALLDPNSSAATLVQPALDQLGITGPDGIISHLTGDAGVEVDSQPGTGVPAGALLFQVDSADAAQRFLSGLATKACALSAGACTGVQPAVQAYGGVEITTFGGSAAGISGVDPSYAVSGDWAIVASSSSEVKAVLDARRGGDITRSTNFTAVAQHVSTSNTAMFYVDISKVVGAVRAVLPSDVAATFDQSVAPYLSHLQAFGGSTRGAGDHSVSTLFLLVS